MSQRIARTLTWKTTDLPFMLSPSPFTPVFNNTDPMLFFPTWVILDAQGNAMMQVARAVDATWITELMSKERERWTSGTG